MSRVMHFEIQASKLLEPMAFQTELLGRKFSNWDLHNHWLIATGAANEPGSNGALLRRPRVKGDSKRWINAFVCSAHVASLDATLSTATALGAEIVFAKVPVPGVGRLAYIEDLDGNVFELN